MDAKCRAAVAGVSAYGDGERGGPADGRDRGSRLGQRRRRVVSPGTGTVLIIRIGRAGVSQFSRSTWDALAISPTWTPPGSTRPSKLSTAGATGWTRGARSSSAADLRSRSSVSTTWCSGAPRARDRSRSLLASKVSCSRGTPVTVSSWRQRKARPRTALRPAGRSSRLCWPPRCSRLWRPTQCSTARWCSPPMSRWRSRSSPRALGRRSKPTGRNVGRQSQAIDFASEPLRLRHVASGSGTSGSRRGPGRSSASSMPAS